MVLTPFRLFLFAVAAFLAAGGTAYYTGALDAYFAPAPRQVAEQEGNGEAGSTAADAGKPAAADEAKAETPKQATAGQDQTKKADAQQSGAADKNERVVVPAFDIVRVEPDGSMVVAGHAAPKSNVEVVSGSTIVGKAQTGPKGDFAVVLDKPLEPGDHQIVLRSTTPQDVVATSKETALVSVPDSEDGEVLALVEAPGKPSRLITKPAAKESEARQEVAEAGNAPADKPAASQSATDRADTQDSGEEAEPAQPRVAMTEPSAGSGKGSAVAGAGSETAEKAEAAQGSASGAAASTEKEAGSAQDAAAATDKPAGSTAQAAGDGSTAVKETSQSDQAATTDDARDAKVFIEAVEIDGKDVFVAGGGIPGQRVRVYANDILLGDAVVSPNGRFLVQTTRELPVGDYIVRADLLSDNGADVVARAAVPFEREPGEKLSAVAPNSRAGGDDQADGGDKEAARQAAENAATESGLAAGNAASSQMAANSPEDAGKQPATSDAASATAETRPQAKMAAADAKGAMELPDLNNGLAENAPVITGPKLESVDGAVIIRRGDTLWQISRRVYGRGVRYSTIYLANQQQIRDPDMIWPGQVFSVPQETKDGETANMKAIGEQAVPTEMAGTEPEWRR